MFCTINKKSISFGCLLPLLVWAHQDFLSCFLESLVSTRDAEGLGDCQPYVCVAEEVDGVGDKGSGDTIMVDVETLFEAFFEAFGLGIIFLNCCSNRLSRLSVSGLKEFYCS